MSFSFPKMCTTKCRADACKDIERGLDRFCTALGFSVDHIGIGVLAKEKHKVVLAEVKRISGIRNDAALSAYLIEHGVVSQETKKASKIWAELGTAARQKSKPQQLLAAIHGMEQLFGPASDDMWTELMFLYRTEAGPHYPALPDDISGAVPNELLVRCQADIKEVRQLCQLTLRAHTGYLHSLTLFRKTGGAGQFDDRMFADFMTSGVDRPALTRGFLIPAFDPSSGDYQRIMEHDGRIADEVFDDVLQSWGWSPQQGMEAISRAPWHEVSENGKPHDGDRLLEGGHFLAELIDRLHKQEPRARYSKILLYTRLQLYFDCTSRPSQDTSKMNTPAWLMLGWLHALYGTGETLIPAWIIQQFLPHRSQAALKASFQSWGRVAAKEKASAGKSKKSVSDDEDEGMEEGSSHDAVDSARRNRSLFAPGGKRVAAGLAGNLGGVGKNLQYIPSMKELVTQAANDAEGASSSAGADEKEDLTSLFQRFSDPSYRPDRLPVLQIPVYLAPIDGVSSRHQTNMVRLQQQQLQDYNERVRRHAAGQKQDAPVGFKNKM